MVNRATVNQVTLVGYLGNDPDVHQTSNGRTVINFRMATQTSIRDENDAWTSRPEWHRVSIFGPLADSMSKILVKGMQVYVSGHLQTRRYTHEDGKERFATDVVAENCFITGKKNGNGEHAEPEAEVPAPKAEANAEVKASGDNNAQPKTPAKRTTAPRQAPPKEEPKPETVKVGEEDELPF